MDWIPLFHQAFERGERSLDLAPGAEPMLYPSGGALDNASPCSADDLEGLLDFMTYPLPEDVRDVRLIRQAKLDLLTDEFEVGSAIDRDAEGVITRVITWAIREQDQIPDPLDQLD